MLWYNDDNDTNTDNNANDDDNDDKNDSDNNDVMIMMEMAGPCFSYFFSAARQGLYSLRRRRLISIAIPIINLRRLSDRLRFIMGIPIPVRRRLLSE